MTTAPIYLLLSRSNTLASRLIRLGTWSEYSHVDIVTPRGTLIGALYGAGVVQYTQSWRLANSTAIQYLVAHCPNPSAVDAFLLAQRGKPYDVSAVLGMLFHRDWQDDDRWFCSELAAAALLAGGLQTVRKDKSRVTPQDLLTSVALSPIDSLPNTPKTLT